jgi:hypothetical protein
LRIEGKRLNKKEKILGLLSILMAIGIIIAAVIGIFYSNGGTRFTTINMYGDTVVLYGDGIYAYNSVLTTANRLGADVAGIIAAIVLIAITLWKGRALWTEIIRTSIIIYLASHSAYLVFGITMNSLYFIYIICFGMSLFLSVIYIQGFLKIIEVPEVLKKKRLTGTGIFLIMIGVITALLWLSAIIPAVLNNTYGSLLGIQTTEATFDVDLSITCPMFVMCGIWVLKKKEIGYKVAFLLLNVMVGVAILVISQRVYCAKLGIDIPIGALIGFIISFVIMGVISLALLIKLYRQLKKVK